MHVSVRRGGAAVLAALTMFGAAPGAAAQGDDPSGSEARASDPEGIEGGGFDDYQTAAEKREAKLAAEYGVGARFRMIYVPTFILELFVDEASSRILQPGFGVELARRKRNFELLLGVEFERATPDDGYWLGKDQDPNVAGEEPDYLEFDGLGWISADVAVRWTAPFNDVLGFRYGAGLGLGVVLGEVLQTDTTCAAGTDDITEDCMADTVAAEGRQLDEPADLPPVFPVLELMVGLQWRPAPKVTINLDAGLRTAPFAGLSSVVYF